jgi:hypothetical protein
MRAPTLDSEKHAISQSGTFAFAASASSASCFGGEITQNMLTAGTVEVAEAAKQVDPDDLPANSFIAYASHSGK